MKLIYLFLTLLICGDAIAQKNKQPNILLIVGDDLSYNFIGPYGDKQVKTPQLDKLAGEGVCFDNMFTSTAMCAPTRQQILTGLYPVRNGAYPNHSQVYRGTKSIAHYLQELGYNTALIGKKHIGGERSFPFKFLSGRDHDGGKGKDIELKDAKKFIADSKKPWMLVVASNQPHSPFNKGNAEAYPPSKIKVPEGYVDTDITRNQLSKYFAEITYLDSLVGDCIKMVESSGEAGNTIILFTSEQGGQFPFGKWTCYDSGLKTAFIAKWPGVVKPGTRSNVLLQYIDVVPTLIDMAGGDYTRINTGNKSMNGSTGLEGKSFFHTLKGIDQKEIRDYVFGVHTTRGIIKGSDCYPVRSVRNKQYLYIKNLNHKATFTNVMTNTPLFASWLKSDNKADKERAKFYQHRPAEELYDIVADPYCLVNLADKNELMKTKAKLSAALDGFMKQQGDKGIETEMAALERQVKGGDD